MDKTVNWQGKWIGSNIMPDDGQNRSADESFASGRGAPWLRTTFECPARIKPARLCIAAPGWFECYINGERVGDQVLAPVATQFTERVSYMVFDVTGLLKPGRNAVAVLLGNGWYNCQTGDVWQFHDAPWRNMPSLLLQIEECGSGKVLASSGASWRAVKSQVVMNALRNGEYQDTRITDANGVSTVEFDDRNAPYADIVNPPPGILVEQECEPCVIAERIAPVKSWEQGSSTVFDFGRNLTGWCEVDAVGAAGETLVLDYAERIDDSGRIQRKDIDQFSKTGVFQQDRYILSGASQQCGMHPHFTYHGFRYVAVNCSSSCDYRHIRIQKITACFIHNGFARRGQFHSSGNAMLEAVQQLNCQSYLCNFTGIPTDCPHREKNGWTGDANLAFETGIWNFDIRLAARHFSQVLMDCQRPSGQLPGIAPSGGWGYNWGSGPAWDSYIFESAWQSWQMAGDDTVMRQHYDGMKLYLEYCRRWHDDDGVVSFGLGDWCPFRACTIPDIGLTSSGFYYQDAVRLAEFAAHLGKKADARHYAGEARRIKEGVNRRYAHDDGGYDNNSLTALAAPLYFGFAADPARTLDKLVRLVRRGAHRSDYGILGAKFVLRVLGENGFKEDLLKILTQPEMPGWGYWVKVGATTFREQWNGNDSQNHIMFGDPSACMYRYLAGIAPAEPGFRSFTLSPAVDLGELPDFECTYDSASGMIRSALETGRRGRREYSCTVPAGTTATLTLNGVKQTLKPGEYKFPVGK